MPDLDKVTLPSGSTYNLKDTQARQDIETLKATAVGAVHYIGVTTTALSDGADTNPITINGASVTAKVLRQAKSKKVIVFKYKPKKTYRKKQGHRQPYTKLQIEKINA